LGVPASGFRFGGSADDRVLGIEPGGLGKVILAGASQSQDWIQSLDPYATGLGGQDGFAISLSFADLQVTPILDQRPSSGDLYFGKDMEVGVQVAAASEPGMDGIVVVRSTDPSRLLISTSYGLQGTDQILMGGADSSANGKFFLQALADNGEVDVVVEGRSAASATGVYPLQVLRVRLAPAALFVSSPKEVNTTVGSAVDVSFFQAPLLPDGSGGPPEDVRYGFTVIPALLSSDPAGLAVQPSISTPFQGSYRASAKAINPGNYTLTPSSSMFSAAPGQSVTVHVGNNGGSSLFSGAKYYLVNGTVAPLYWYGSPGDSLVVTSDDPSRLRVGLGASTADSTVVWKNGATLYVTALAGDGIAGLHVSGTYKGQPVSDATQVALVPYTVALSAPPATLGVGAAVIVSVTLTAQPTPAVANWTYLPGTASPAVFAGVKLQSSNSSVLWPQGTTGVLAFTIAALQPGTATLSFPSPAPPGFASLGATVQVVPATLNFGVSVIRIPGPQGSAYIYPVSGFTTAPFAALKSVRLRLSAGAPAVLQSLSATGTDVTMDFTTPSQYMATVIARDAQPGQQATLYVSAPGIAEFPIPIHFVKPVFLPDFQELRTAVGAPQYTSSATYHLAADDAGQVVELGLRAQVMPTVTVFPVTSPPGICTAPASVDVIGFGSFSVPLTCTAAGETMLSLQPGPGVSSAESQSSVMRVISQAPAPAPVPLVTRVFVGNGLQSELSMWLPTAYGSIGPFTGTLTSNDPDHVRLSIDRNAPGSASVTLPANGRIQSVFVQGCGSDGFTTISAQTIDGRTAQITVYLFPSTLAVRPPDQFAGYSSDLSAILSLNQPLSTPDFAVSVRPYLVDPGSKKLIWNSALSIRGGSDPVFVRAQTSDASIAQTAPPDAIVSEGDTSAALKFHANAVGDVILSATQPDGFISVPDSTLQTHVFERGLAFSSPVVLSADLETDVAVVSPGDGNSVASVTATSLDPQKLVISNSQATPGQASVTASNSHLYLQALSGVKPGDQVGVRLEAPGYVASQATVTFAPAELQVNGTVPLSLQPLSNANLTLVYGPVDSQGHVSFNGSLRPGVNQTVQVSSSDSSVISVAQQTIPLSPYMTIPLRTVAPGHTQILVQAPAGITNRAAAVDVTVGPYQFFPGPQVDYPSRYLVSKFTVTNPRPQPTTVTITSNGNAPARLGTAVSGTGAPSAATLTVTLDANETHSLYLEPAGTGNSVQIQLTASDFAPQTTSQILQDPLASFLEGNPLNLSLGGGSIPITAVLYGSYPKRELPLGTGYGPLSVQVQSSNPNVVSVPAAPIAFNPGDSRKSVLLQPVGTGDAVVSLIVPASFAGSSPARQDIVVSVR
jgi:hypothetical protein